MILHTSPYKSIPTADGWYSSWFHIQEKPRVFYIIHIVSHWAVCRLCTLHLNHLNFAVSVVSFTGVQAAPDLVNMTTKLAWFPNFVAGACCNVPLVISNVLAMFPACNGKQEAGEVDFAKCTPLKLTLTSATKVCLHGKIHWLEPAPCYIIDYCECLNDLIGCQIASYNP